jgi:hypothetical protein
MKIPGKRENLKYESVTVHRVGYDLSPPGDCYIVQKMSDKEVVSTRDVKWAKKYRVGKRIVQFDHVTKDVKVRETEELDHDIRAMTLDDDPEIIREKSDYDDDIMGRSVWSQNAVAVPSLIEKVLAAVACPTANTTQNPNAGDVPQSVGKITLLRRVRKESLSTVEK